MSLKWCGSRFSISASGSFGVLSVVLRSSNPTPRRRHTSRPVGSNNLFTRSLFTFLALTVENAEISLTLFTDYLVFRYICAISGVANLASYIRRSAILPTNRSYHVGLFVPYQLPIVSCDQYAVSVGLVKSISASNTCSPLRWNRAEEPGSIT